MMLKISDICIEICGDIPDSVKNKFSDYSFYGGSPDMRIKFCVQNYIQAKRLDYIYGIKRGISEFGKITENGIEKYILQDRVGVQSHATLIFCRDFTDIECQIADIDSAAVRLEERIEVALGQCVLNALPRFGGIFFHSSCIAFNEAAVMFSAASGGGKSTHAALWKECYPLNVRYINDDTPIIRKTDGIYNAFGSPWAGTSGINENVSAPIKAIIYLKKDSQISLHMMDEREKALRAMQSVRMQFFPVQRQRQTKILFDFTRNVPVYELSCDVSKEAAEVVKSEIF